MNKQLLLSQKLLRFQSKLELCHNDILSKRDFLHEKESKLKQNEQKIEIITLTLFKKLLQIAASDTCKIESATHSHVEISKHLNQAILDIEETLTLDFNLHPRIVSALREGVESQNRTLKNLTN